MDKTTFHKNVDYLLANWPDHPLLPSIQRGYSRINVAYLTKALDEWHNGSGPVAKVENEVKPQEAKPEKKPAKSQKANPIQKGENPSGVPKEVRQMYRENRTLWAKSRALSNSFHTCSTDAQRAQVSTKIKDLHSLIVGNRMKIKAWHQKSIIPVPGELVEGASQMNGVDLMKCLASLRSSLSRYRAQVKKLKALPRGHERRERLDLYALKIDHKQNQINYVESLIEEAPE